MEPFCPETRLLLLDHAVVRGSNNPAEYVEADVFLNSIVRLHLDLSCIELHAKEKRKLAGYGASG